MPKTIGQGLLLMRRNLTISDIQQSNVSGRQLRIRRILSNRIKVLESFLTGSYIRKTMIPPLSESDIDMFIVLHPIYFKNISSPAELLDGVRQLLLVTYPDSDISRNGQAVTIAFNDFNIDVVPSFILKLGHYYIPDSINNRWIITNPRKHIIIWRKENELHGGKLLFLIKIMKCWNRNHSSLLRSFHLETMVVQIMHGVPISDFPSAITYVFAKAIEIVKQKNPDPAGYHDDAGDYLDTDGKIQDVVNRMDTAYRRSYEAIIAAKQGKTMSAYEKWGQIFGSYWPSYQ